MDGLSVGLSGRSERTGGFAMYFLPLSVTASITACRAVIASLFQDFLRD